MTGIKRATFLACAQGKQTKNVRSRLSFGLNSSINVIGEVTCSDLKGPMTFRDRFGNRLLVNFVDAAEYPAFILIRSPTK